MPQRTIDQRMQAVHERILQARGVLVANAQESTGEEGLPDRKNGSIWRNFDKCNDAPIFALKRRKAQVG